MEMQVRRDDVTYQNIIALSKDGLDNQEKLKVSMKEETSQIREQMAAFQLEVRHRFELQSAENKRLSQHVTSLKQENRQLQTDLVMALEKLRQLELELSEDPVGGANEE
ncbi:unnamed protein product [Symbiodinium microadriaticum]|nr:unnamed protein product [Symbiodinium microadriaticum]